ncbi:YcjF family protein [Myxosarcina sp. GI1(2024)]
MIDIESSPIDNKTEKPSQKHPLEQVFENTWSLVETTIETASSLGNVTEQAAIESHKLLELATAQTGQTLKAIAGNPLLQGIDRIFGLDWLMTLLGQVNTEEVRATVDSLRIQYPQETASQIAHRLIVRKTWQAGRLGLITNIIPPVAAILLGVELIATTKLQSKMVYEIAAAYGLELDEPARRGEVLAIFGLSLGGNFLKTGLSLVEIIPGIGAVIGASSDAALLYVLGRTACRFYEGKYQPFGDEGTTQAWETQTAADWNSALAQSQIINRILAHMIRATYPENSWSEILPKIDISPDSVKEISTNLENLEPFESLLAKLSPDFAPLALSRCYAIARANDGEITSKQQAIIDAIAVKFELDLRRLEETN